MKNCVSKKPEGDNSTKTIKKVSRPFCWQKKGLLMWFTAGKINGVKTSYLCNDDER